MKGHVLGDGSNDGIGMLTSRQPWFLGEPWANRRNICPHTFIERPQRCAIEVTVAKVGTKARHVGERKYRRDGHHLKTTDPQDFQMFRAARDAELTEPYGWLTLLGFHWLPTEASPLPGLSGRWWADSAPSLAHLGVDIAAGLS